MRCATRPDPELSETCTSPATHLLLWSLPDPRNPNGPRKRMTEPVCKPCGDLAYRRRPALKARVVPLHIYTPSPAFIIANGHRLVADHKHGERCFDCGRTGTTKAILQGLYGCHARPESVTSRELPTFYTDAELSLADMATQWWTYTTREIGMGIEDWRPVPAPGTYAATFTFRDREYGLRYSPNIIYVWAEKVPNRGRPAPKLINPEDREGYKQVIFHIHNLVNKYDSTYFATYTPGREDVILYAPEGQISAVLRLTDLRHPSNPLDEITDAVCDAFGAVADLTFQTRIYE